MSLMYRKSVGIKSSICLSGDTTGQIRIPITFLKTVKIDKFCANYPNFRFALTFRFPPIENGKINAILYLSGKMLNSPFFKRLCELTACFYSEL